MSYRHDEKRRRIASFTKEGEEHVTAAAVQNTSYRQFPWRKVIDKIVYDPEPLLTLRTKASVLHHLSLSCTHVGEEIRSYGWSNLANKYANTSIMKKKSTYIESRDLANCTDARLEEMAEDFYGEKRVVISGSLSSINRRAFVNTLRNFRARVSKDRSLLDRLRVKLAVRDSLNLFVWRQQAYRHYGLQKKDADRLTPFGNRLCLFEVQECALEKYGSYENLIDHNSRKAVAAYKRRITLQNKAQRRTDVYVNSFKIMRQALSFSIRLLHQKYVASSLSLAAAAAAAADDSPGKKDIDEMVFAHKQEMVLSAILASLVRWSPSVTAGECLECGIGAPVTAARSTFIKSGDRASYDVIMRHYQEQGDKIVEIVQSISLHHLASSLSIKEMDFERWATNIMTSIIVIIARRFVDV